MYPNTECHSSYLMVSCILILHQENSFTIKGRCKAVKCCLDMFGHVLTKHNLLMTGSKLSSINDFLKISRKTTAL